MKIKIKAKIISIKKIHSEDGRYKISSPDCKNGIVVTNAYMERFSPKPGGFYIEMSNGAKSYEKAPEPKLKKGRGGKTKSKQPDEKFVEVSAGQVVVDEDGEEVDGDEGMIDTDMPKD